MNWTTREPIEGVKCIVETDFCTFPAIFIDGEWVHYIKRTPLYNVKRWIIYPEGEDPNDYVPPTVLLKYAFRKLREDKKIIQSLRILNHELTDTYNKIAIRNKELNCLNSNLTITCNDLKKKCQEACDNKVKEIEKRNRKLIGYIKSMEHIFKSVNTIEEESNNNDE